MMRKTFIIGHCILYANIILSIMNISDIIKYTNKLKTKIVTMQWHRKQLNLY